jgi:hypothetical protein
MSNDGNLPLIGLSFSVGVDDTLAVADKKPALTFVPAEGFNPSLTDTGVDGLLAVAWLKGLYAPPGRTLLGYVQGAAGAQLTFGGVVANARDGSSPHFEFRRAR